MLARQKDHADAVLAWRRQDDALRREFFAIESIRNLDQDAGAIAAQGIGPHGAAMVEVLQDQQRLLDECVTRLALDVRDESHAAGVVLPAGVVQTELSGRIDCTVQLLAFMIRSANSSDV